MKVVKAVVTAIGVGIILWIGLGVHRSIQKTAQAQDENALVSAAASGNVVRVNSLLIRGVNVNARAFDGTSGLWAAAFNRRLLTVRALLLNGANPQAASQSGQTPLEGAVEVLGDDDGCPEAKTDVAIINLLISKGADTSRVKRNARSVALLRSHGIRV